MLATKHTQHAPSMKTECDYLYGLIKRTITNTKISPKMVNPRGITENAEEEGEDVLGYHFDAVIKFHAGGVGTFGVHQMLSKIIVRNAESSKQGSRSSFECYVIWCCFVLVFVCFL